MALIFTQADLDALKAAWLTGALEVRVGDRWVKYDTREELEVRIREVAKYLDGEKTSDESPNTIQASFSRGEG